MHSADHIADQILALINAKPRTPTKDEIAAILAPHMNAASPKVGVPKHRAEWDALSAEVRAAEAKCDALNEASGGILTKEVETAEEEVGPIDDRLSDCAERILAEPVHDSADLMLLAEAWYWIMWNEPCGLTAPNADERLADGPPYVIVESGDCMDALAALFRGIRDATRGASSSQPIVPAPAMPAPDVRTTYVASDWHRILAVHLDAIRRAKTEDEQDALHARLHTVAIATCGKPVRTFDDLIVRAAIVARWYSDEIGNPTHPEDDMIAAVVRGVLDLAGLKFDAEGRLLDEEPAAA